MTAKKCMEQMHRNWFASYSEWITMQISCSWNKKDFDVGLLKSPLSTHITGRFAFIRNRRCICPSIYAINEFEWIRAGKKGTSDNLTICVPVANLGFVHCICIIIPIWSSILMCLLVRLSLSLSLCSLSLSIFWDFLRESFFFKFLPHTIEPFITRNNQKLNMMWCDIRSTHMHHRKLYYNSGVDGTSVSPLFLRRRK